MANPGIMAPLPSRIASLVHSHFDALPARSKPNNFPDGSREWIPMASIVAVKGMYIVKFSLIVIFAWVLTKSAPIIGENTPSESIHCIAITYVLPR